MLKNPKYKIGDKVKIVKYGHLIWEHKNAEICLSFPVYKEFDNYRILDMKQHLIGQIGIIDTINIVQGMPQYALSGINGKHAWYNEKQLKLMKQ